MGQFGPKRVSESLKLLSVDSGHWEFYELQGSWQTGPEGSQ